MSSRASNVFSIQSMQVVYGYLKGCRVIEKEGFDEFKHRLRRDGEDVLKELPWIGDTRKYQLAREIGLLSAFGLDAWLVRCARACIKDEPHVKP